MATDTSIYSISPIDGRYAAKTSQLKEYFSEFSLIKTRVEVEIEYLIALSDQKIKGLRTFENDEKSKFRSMYTNFSETNAIRVKEIESEINHDVKAVEYFIKERSKSLNINFNQEFIHFGLTSQDINNTAFPLMLKRYMDSEFIPHISLILFALDAKSEEWTDIPLLAKTHGQPASPTTLAKEITVFSERLRKQLAILESASHGGKFGGATGNFNAHKLAYPDIDWREFGDLFLNKIGLDRQQTTTQIEHYDGMAHIFDTTKRIQNILVDFARDIWSYISFEIFSQKINKNEVGSSTMPHKVNPIDRKSVV